MEDRGHAYASWAHCPRSLATPWAGAGRTGLLSRVKERADEGNRGAEADDGGPGARGCERARARPPKNN